MTLSPNCLSAEPAATPGDPFACFGVPAQAPGAATAATPFASLLIQADALGSIGATPAVVTAPPAGATAPTSVSANTPASTPGIFFLPLGEPLAEPSAEPSDAAGEVPSENPHAAGSQSPTLNAPAPYLGVNYTPLGKPQVGAVVALAPVSVPTDGLVGQQVAASAQTRVAGKKPAATQESSPEEKQNVPAKSAEPGSDNSGQNALQLAYQFIAGQWVQQAMPEPVVAELAATSNLDPQSTAQISTATPSVVSDPPAYRNGQPAQDSKPASEPVSQTATQTGRAAASVLIPTQAGQASLAVASAPEQSDKEQRAGQPGPKQRVGQPGSEAVRPASDQSRVVTAPVAVSTQAGQQPLSSTVSSVLPKSSASPSVPVEVNDRSKNATRKETPVDAATLAPESQHGAASPTDLSAATPGIGIQPSLWRLSQGRPVQLQAQEKIAVPAQPGTAEITSEVYTSSDAKEKKPVVNGSKELSSTKPNIGTDTADRENAMPHSAVNKASAVVLPSFVDDGIRAGNGSSVVQVEGSIAAHAPKLVQEIRQIADRISVIDRNTVEVRFDFSDTDRLSVRVEYRDGAVHTTFRTDSSQLRDAISHEWQAQSAVTEQKSYRIAEPVFSQTASDRQNFSSTGGGDSSGRQRAFEQASQSGTPSFASTGRNAGSHTPVAAPSARSSRPDNSLHLHALA